MPRGAPRGNTNALKSGAHTRAMKALRARVREHIRACERTLARLPSGTTARRRGPRRNGPDTLPSRPMEIRNADPSELDALARLWHEGWLDAHVAIVPRRLAELRTLASFRDRIGAALADVRAAGPVGAPAGFSINKDDELYQLYVARAARGSGLAMALTREAEARLAAAGVKTAWLACTVGNDRAARFYEKAGWTRVRTEPYLAETSEGPFPLNVWRYEKRLAP